MGGVKSTIVKSIGQLTKDNRERWLAYYKAYIEPELDELYKQIYKLDNVKYNKYTIIREYHPDWFEVRDNKTGGISIVHKDLI